MTKLRRTALILVATAVGLSGCSIASQHAAVPLPLHLTDSTTTTVSVVTPTNQLSVYFLQDGRLVAVPVPYYPTDPVGSALEALGIGPTASQARRGITTGFHESPVNIQIAGTVTKGGIASVTVDTSFLNLSVIALEEASAQVVFTLTGLANGPNSVRFILDGQALESFVPPGRLVNRAVTRLDYCDFAPLNYTPCAHIASPT
jgi:spore germination protein GerM